MASIYDFGGLPQAPKPEPEPKKRSKKRESLSTTEVRQGKLRLAEVVERAFTTLEDAMENADFSTAVKAAQIILDRSGFGPKSTVDVNTTTMDLSSLSREELAERASKISKMLRAQQDAARPVIDVTPTSTGTIQ